MKENGYIWAVTYISRDDGHRLTAAYFRDKGDADTYCATTAHGDDQQVVQTTLWQDGDRWYKVERREVEVDVMLSR